MTRSFFEQRIDQGRHAGGRDDGVGMAVEGDDHRNGPCRAASAMVWRRTCWWPR